MSKTSTCSHLDMALNHGVPVAKSATECPECVKSGDTWVHLRRCLTCGNVGCCDSSKNKHATAHFTTTNHPVMQTAQPGEEWLWCYVDEIMA